ncbi:hypothetical protein C2G38_2093578, partial [Gigaspora rosea]
MPLEFFFFSIHQLSHYMYILYSFFFFFNFYVIYCCLYSLSLPCNSPSFVDSILWFSSISIEFSLSNTCLFFFLSHFVLLL